MSAAVWIPAVAACICMSCLVFSALFARRAFEGARMSLRAASELRALRGDHGQDATLAALSEQLRRRSSEGDVHEQALARAPELFELGRHQAAMRGVSDTPTLTRCDPGPCEYPEFAVRMGLIANCVKCYLPPP